MCGRFSLGLPHGEIQALHGYNVQVAEWIEQDQFVPRHNIAPRSQAPVLHNRETGEGNEIEPAADVLMHTMKWGLVPHWSKHEDKTLSTTNARSENLVEGGGMWASIKGKRRCAVLCQGYYEWLRKGKERFPHFTKHKDGRLMLLAGLYDRTVLEGESQPLWTFTIVTTAANKEFEWLHDRQPVILSSTEALKTWLDTSTQKWAPGLSELVEPYSDSSSPLVCYQVPKEVGKVGTESPTFIQPISERKDGIQAMFSKQQAAATSFPKKRKRSASPSQCDIKRDVKEEGLAATPPKPSVEKLNTWEDDSDIEYIDGPYTPKPEAARKARREQIREAPTSSQESPAKRSRQAKGQSEVTSSDRQQVKAEGSAKITSFFAKS